MRLRLYRIGTRSKAIAFRFDAFPAVLRLDREGNLSGEQGLGGGGEGINVCELIDIGGQFEIAVIDQTLDVTINGAPVESGPLMPGDRLRVQNHYFVVSYERTAAERPPAMKCRILS